MSQQALADFFTALPENPTLAERLQGAVAQHDGPDAIEAVTHIVTEAGYDVDAADVATFRSGVLQALEDSDLSEENLENVAGGVLELAIAVGVGVGIPLVGALGTAASVGSIVAINSIDRSFSNRIDEFFSKW